MSLLIWSLQWIFIFNYNLNSLLDNMTVCMNIWMIEAIITYLMTTIMLHIIAMCLYKIKFSKTNRFMLRIWLLIFLPNIHSKCGKNIWLSKNCNSHLMSLLFRLLFEKEIKIFSFVAFIYAMNNILVVWLTVSIKNFVRFGSFN